MTSQQRPTVRLSETVYVVATPDGQRYEFTDPSEAQMARAATPGSQLRTVPRERDVPAVYAVVADGVEVSRHDNPRDASLAARSTPGAVVMLMPDE